jgi:drug/metabolite transporter (DMT)-like permease
VALRHVSWTDLIVSSALVYLVVAGALLVTGAAAIEAAGRPVAIAVGACAVGGLVLSTVALLHADASRAVPFMSTYPLVTVLLAALVLSESVSPAQGLGVGLVIAGVVLLAR